MGKLRDEKRNEEDYDHLYELRVVFSKDFYMWNHKTFVQSCQLIKGVISSK